jgi:Uma2 family endonuclease
MTALGQRGDETLSDEEFERLALEDPDGKWELWNGRPCRKPVMTLEHDEVADNLAFALQLQIDRRRFRVRVDKGRVPRRSGRYFIPDIYVIPIELSERRRGRTDGSYAETLYQDGMVGPALLPDVRIDLGPRFD